VSNVVQFPVERLNVPPQSIEEMQDSISIMRKEHVDNLMDMMIPSVLMLFETNGMDVETEAYVKDSALVIEAIKALMYKYYNLEHPLNFIAETCFDIRMNSDESISYNYDISLSNEPNEPLGEE
jgi:hypothetical protein